MRRRKSHAPLVQLLLLLLVMIFAPAAVVDATSSQEHSHKGKLRPFEPGDPKIDLNDRARKLLASGKPYKTQVQSGNAGRGLVIQDVHAPPEIVWERILDFDHYAKMVPRTQESNNYRVSKERNGQELIYTRMKIGIAFFNMAFFIRHVYSPALSSLTWTLDYDKMSDLDDSVGFWYVTPHPTNTPATTSSRDTSSGDPKRLIIPQSKSGESHEWSRVYYSVEISMGEWVPGVVMSIMKNKALTDAIGWVKKYSEQEFKKVQQENKILQTTEETLKPPVANISSDDETRGRKGANRVRLGKFVKQFLGLRNRNEHIHGENRSASEGRAPFPSMTDASDEESKPVPKGGTCERGNDENVVGVGLIRYVWVLLVFILTFYNIILCVERLAQ